MEPTPASLLDRLRSPLAGDGWVRFVNLYTPLLYHWANRLERDADAAADLVQDVFAALVRELPRFEYDPARRFRGWLWTLTANTARTRKRRAATLAAGDRRTAVPHLAPDPADEFTEVEYNQYLTGRALQILRADFEPATWRTFWEHVAVGRPAPDVAREMGTTVGAVYATKTRVLARLREELRGLLD